MIIHIKSGVGSRNYLLCRAAQIVHYHWRVANNN